MNTRSLTLRHRPASTPSDRYALARGALGAERSRYARSVPRGESSRLHRGHTTLQSATRYAQRSRDHMKRIDAARTTRHVGRPRMLGSARGEVRETGKASAPARAVNPWRYCAARGARVHIVGCPARENPLRAATGACNYLQLGVCSTSYGVCDRCRKESQAGWRDPAVRWYLTQADRCVRKESVARRLLSVA